MPSYRHILVPLDGSELAERSLNPAQRIARAAPRAAGAAGDQPVRIVLLRAVTPVSLVAADPLLYDELSRMATDEAQAYLNAVADKLPAGSITVEAHVVRGPAADAIVHYAEENNVDLIVIASHGRTGSERWVYGSVAERVLHHAPCATVVIRAQAPVDMFEHRTILVPLDGSELAEEALAPAAALARSVGSDLVLLRIVPASEPIAEQLTSSVDSLQSALGSALTGAKDEAEAYLQKVYGSLPNEHLFIDAVVTNEPVADAIAGYAASHHVDLIVMSSHGRSGIGRWLYGSVAEQVLRRANCATMIIRSGRN